MARSNSVPSWILTSMLAFPDSMHTWSYGTNKQGTRRSKALYRLLTAANIPAELVRDDRHPPGLWKLSFPVKHYREAERISDKCYVGENWWPTKPKSKEDRTV